MSSWANKYSKRREHIPPNYIPPNLHQINVFLLCYNESALIPHTVKHYKKYVPSCKITIYDNESTDNSVEIAKSLGCDVVSWSSNNTFNEFLQVHLRNTVWKKIQSGWIIMADMDEFVCVTENELIEEQKSGVSIITISGKNMIGESETIDVTDIDLQDINKYIDNSSESKHLCFLREKIKEMNYGLGSHTSNPVGYIKYSSKTYINKHMEYVGLPFLINKYIKRYERCDEMRKKYINIHYTNDIDEIKNRYTTSLVESKSF